MSARLPMAVVAATLAAAGCDFDGELARCAQDEQCVLVNEAKPALRFPHNGAGLGNENAVLAGTPWKPKKAFLAWDYDGNDTWKFRIQLHECGPGQGLDDCPFADSRSNIQPDVPGTTTTLENELKIGKRYWWRVRACQQTLPGTPCGPWSDARYFDVGRPEAIPNDFTGAGKASLAVLQRVPLNAGTAETVYLYTADPSGPMYSTQLSVGPPNGLTTQTYQTVAGGAGDLDGDGYSELAVGFWPNFGGVPMPVAVDVYSGAPSGLQSGSYRELGPHSEDFGRPVGRAGDVNGDGYSDLAVCEQKQGRVLVFFGGPSGTMDSPAGDVQLLLPSAAIGGGFCAFAALGDVNADGFDDIAVAGAGQLRVFQGRPSSGEWTGALEVLAPAGTVRFGSSLAGGDFNGDGHGDLVVAGGNGKAYLYLGNVRWFTVGGTPLPASFFVLVGEIAMAGDVNDDGFADLAAGGAGQVQLFLGRATDVPQAGPTLQDAALPNFGVSFAGVGDVTADYYDDFAVGSTGGVNVYRGGPSSNDLGTQRHQLASPAGSSQFGIGIASGF